MPSSITQICAIQYHTSLCHPVSHKSVPSSITQVCTCHPVSHKSVPSSITQVCAIQYHTSLCHPVSHKSVPSSITQVCAIQYHTNLCHPCVVCTTCNVDITMTGFHFFGGGGGGGGGAMYRVVVLCTLLPRGVWGHAPPGIFGAFRPSEVTSGAFSDHIT